MKKRNWIIYLFTFIFLLSIVFIVLFQISSDVGIPFSLTVSSHNSTEDIEGWLNEDECYFFLPSYAELSQVNISKNTSNELYLDGELLESGMTCENLSFDTEYELTFSSWGQSKSYKVTFLRSSGMPTMYLDTQTGSMDYIHSDKENEEKGTFTFYSADGISENSGEVQSINGHGNTTWEEYDKKSYSITLAQPCGLNGMESAQRWILIANGDDPSNIRNKMVYDFAAEIGLEYSPDSSWVDLYLNGEYAGLYLLCERNEVHENRVNIENEDSFLVSLELDFRLQAQNYPCFYTNAGQAFRILYPLNVTTEKENVLTQTWQSLENALLAPDGIDPETGRSWEEMIDVDSWAKKYLVEELFGNLDGGFISQYFYLDATEDEPVIYAGPVWDYGYAMGNEYIWQLSEPASLNVDRLLVKDGYESPWFYHLLRQESFCSRVMELYTAEIRPVFEDMAENGVNDYLGTVSDSAQLNVIRWFSEDEDIVSSCDYISDYLTERLEFLDNLWIEKQDYNFVIAEHGLLSGNLGYFAVKSGEAYGELPVLNDIEGYTFAGWVYSDTYEPYDPAKEITSDVHVTGVWIETRNKAAELLRDYGILPVIALLFAAFVIVDIKRTKGGRNKNV